MMKVLHITSTFFPAVGGIETVVRELVSNLRRNGIVADVLHVAPSNAEFRRDYLDDATVWRVPLFPNRLVGITPSIRSLLMNYDLLHVHDPQGMALSANVLFQGRGKKKLLSTHGGYFHTKAYSLAKQLHWRWLAATILKEYDAVLASSISDCESFKTKAPHVKLVTNGVNVAKFTSVSHHRSIRSATRWIYCGRLSLNKRIDLLIDTVKQVRDAGLGVNLTIAGEDFDGLLPSIRARIVNHRLDDHVRVVGSLSDEVLLTEFSNHSVFITASEYEGFGLSVVEAMAAGLMVICRNIAPLNSFVLPGRNGALIEFDGSGTDLASIKALCAASSSEISAMQKFARSTAMPHSWETAVKRYIAVYDELLRDETTAA